MSTEELKAERIKGTSALPHRLRIKCEYMTYDCGCACVGVVSAQVPLLEEVTPPAPGAELAFHKSQIGGGFLQEPW